MKAVNIRELKQELKELEEDKLIDLCLHLARFKKENKELLTYLLFKASDESLYIEEIKEEMDELFSQIPTYSFYVRSKYVRKILRLVKKYIRYSKKKETLVQLLLHFCSKLREIYPSFNKNRTMRNLYVRQIQAIEKAMSYLHEDLQYDYQQELERLND